MFSTDAIFPTYFDPLVAKSTGMDGLPGGQLRAGTCLICSVSQPSNNTQHTAEAHIGQWNGQGRLEPSTTRSAGPSTAVENCSISWHHRQATKQN